MTDKFSKEIRSKTMKAIKSSHTKLEDFIIKILWQKGFRFRRNVKDLKGKPDIAIKKYKTVIFIDSCFWHGCNEHLRLPDSNKEYWINKIQRNRQRDIEINDYYTSQGWKILRIWEHELKKDKEQCLLKIIDFLNKAKA